jgi:ataxia telangiectasia mutated family protein
MERQSVLNDAFFDRYCKATHREPAEALRDCFTQIVAGSIVFDSEAAAPSKSQSNSFQDWILQCAHDCDPGRDPRDYVKERAAAIAAAIFSYGGDVDYHSEGAIVDHLRHSSRDHGAMWVKTFRKLNQYRRFDDFPMHQVHFPAATTESIIKSLGWFTTTFVGQSGEQEGMSHLYHIIHHLFAAVHSTPLVNEQLRYIHSLCICLSISEGALAMAPMIQAILTHSIALLSQEDMTHSAQSIITWSLECARHANDSCQDIGLGALISRIAELSVRFSNSKDQRTSSMGFQLLGWVEAELQRLCEVDAFQEELQVVITLWPRPLRIQRNDITDEDFTERTARVLSRGDASPTGRFRVVRQLNQIPMYSTGIFATEHFWTLKESIPVDDLLMHEDLCAFMELLYKGSGKFHSIRSDAPEEDGLAHRHRQAPEEPVKHAIVTWLLSQMAVVTADTLDTIHNTLRRLCHPICGVPLSNNDTVLSLFRAGAQEPLQVVECDMSFLKKQASRDLASNYEKWLCDTAIFFGQILSKADIFYAQIHSLLTESDTFATNLLPILVHQVLSSDYDGVFEAPMRAILSNYFLTLMRSSTTDTIVLQAIIDLILHLRHFERPGDDPVGYDKWLDIGLMDVCKTSLKCGAYTTSLLFLELAQEYRDGDDNSALDEWELDTETVLYEIYRHIEEPDGFYAIKGKDIRKHLIQKFHHENKWDKAFQSHVSQFEVAQSGIQSGASRHNLFGVVESLHSYGFSHLAMSLARSMSEDTSADFIYSLAWRTDAWDLPQILNYDSRNASLYGVMRAVHRGKDIESTKLLCELAARREMQTLRTTNPENVVEIRNSIQSLLCFREIQHWVQDWRQLQSQPISSSAKRFNKYFVLSPELEYAPPLEQLSAC